MSTPEVSKNEDGTWHAPGAGDHRTKAEATQALQTHQEELAAAREQRSRSGSDVDVDVATMTPADLMDYVDNAPIAARPARRADLTGQGRTLDAVGNEV
jgi:hypothetical protein